MTREEAVRKCSIYMLDGRDLVTALEALGLLKFDPVTTFDIDDEVQAAQSKTFVVSDNIAEYFKNNSSKKTAETIIKEALVSGSLLSDVKLASLIINSLLIAKYKIVDDEQFEIIEKKPQSYYDNLEFKPMIKMKTPEREDLYIVRSSKHGIIRLFKDNYNKGLCLSINGYIVWTNGIKNHAS